MAFCIVCIIAGLSMCGVTTSDMPAEVFCPVAGKMMPAGAHRAYGGEEVYFCCDSCADEFDNNPSRYTANANAQLAGLGTAVQRACPLSGELTSDEYTVVVAGVPVHLANAQLMRQVQAAAQDQQVKLVFGQNAFTRGFRLASAAAGATGQTTPADCGRFPWTWLLLLLVGVGVAVWTSRARSPSHFRRRP